MNIADILVLLGGGSLVLFILWFFFGEKTTDSSAIAPTKNGKQEVTIIVEAGYQPNKVVATKDKPLTIIFDRRDRGECTERVIFPKIKIRNEKGEITEKQISLHLPEDEKTSVTFTPVEAGLYEFMCGMAMVHGKLEVK